MNIGQVMETHLGWAASRLGFRAVTPVFDGATEREIQSELARAWLVERAWDVVTAWAWDWLEEIEYDTTTLTDDEAARLFFITSWLSEKGYDPHRLQTEPVHARMTVVREWLKMEVEPEEIFADFRLKKQERIPYDDRAIRWQRVVVCLDAGALWREPG